MFNAQPTGTVISRRLALRRDICPEQTLLRDKLYGNLEELRRTAAFVRYLRFAYDDDNKEEEEEEDTFYSVLDCVLPLQEVVPHQVPPLSLSLSLPTPGAPLSSVQRHSSACPVRSSLLSQTLHLAFILIETFHLAPFPMLVFVPLDISK